jgi:hypothetical protein
MLISGRKSLAVVGLAVVLLTGLTYYSGPVLNVSVSDRDIAKATAIWHDLRGTQDYCIKDDLGVILALEYVSAKEFQETVNNSNCNSN